MGGIGECTVRPLLSEDDEVEEIHRRFAGFREGYCVDSCLTDMTRFFSVY